LNCEEIVFVNNEVSLEKHQQLAGAFLFLFGIFELGILLYTILKAVQLYSEMAGSGVENVYIAAVSFGVILSLIMFCVQLKGGYLLMKLDPKAWGWGIAASVIAITTLWAAPAGIYAIWTRLQFDKRGHLKHAR